MKLGASDCCKDNLDGKGPLRRVKKGGSDEPSFFSMVEFLPTSEQTQSTRMNRKSRSGIIISSKALWDQYRSKTEKDMRHAQIPYREMYLLYGVLLVELKRIPEAQEALKKGLRWNPVCFHMMSEYIETYKMSGDLEQFFILTKEAFKIAFRPTDLAQCYRNLGYYFVEKKLWPEAIACNLLSLEYDKEAKAAQSELYYINNATDGKIPEPSIDQTREYSKKYGFPFGPDRDILGLSYAYGKHFLEEKEPNAARYFLSITYGLTGDPEIKEIIEKLSQEE